MKHLRGSGVAIALMVLLAGVALAAGDPIADLESKLAKIEAALKEESADLRPMILRELTAARRELRQALQERFDMLSELAATTPEEQKAKSARLEKLRSRIDELNRQLAEPAAPPSAQPPAAAPTQPSAAQPPASAAPLPETPGDASTAAHAPATPPEAAPLGPPLPPPQRDADSFLKPEFTPEPKLPKIVKLRVDISREWNDPDAENKCSNRPFSQSAKVWKLVVVADALWEGQTSRSPHYFVDDKKNLFIPIATIKDNPKVAMVVGARTYLGHPERRVREVRLVFENLSLAEMSDLADHLANHAEEIQKAYRESIAKFEVFQVAFSYDPTKKLDDTELYDVLTCNLNPVQQPDAFHQMLVGAAQGIQLERCLAGFDPQKAPEAMTMSVKAKTPFDLTALLQSARLDTESIKETKRMAGVLINNQAQTWSSDADEQKRISGGAVAKKKAAAATGVTLPAIPPLEIEEPCFRLSISPLLSGNEFKPVASFRFRYDYYTADDKISMKLRAEGEGAEGGQYFQRVKIGGEATGLFGHSEKGWQVSGGGVGHYSFTRKNGMQVDEWQAGGKLQVQAPYVRLFDSRAGSDSRPTFIFESGAAGGTGSSTKAVDFGLTSNFRYTLRPNPRVSLDMKADGGWSNQPRYANEKTFFYVSAQGRFNLEASWDYVVRYECGQKEPDYRKFCGWQTGIVLVTGR